MLRLGAGLAGNFLAYQMGRPFAKAGDDARRREELQKKSAASVKAHLQEMRGPVMKVGQALSMQTHALGADWIKELSTLQMQVPPMHYSLMRAQFKASVGMYPEEAFKSFDEEPVAAASLGQVHWAETKEGEKVAVKIQYPAVREAVEEDFRMLKLAGLPARWSGHLQDSIIEEARRGILEETDYRNEAKNLEFFRKALAPLPFIHVPRVYPKLSGDRVLTMSRMGGKRLTDFLKGNPSQKLRDEIGEGLVRLFFFQVFKARALHADPHPGNYLFNDDGTIGLVDFGCVKFLADESVRCYAQFWSRDWIDDEPMYREMLRVILGRDRGREAGARKTMMAIKAFYDEFHPLDRPNHVHDVGDPRFMDGVTELAKTLLQNKFLSPQFLFLSRTESGMCNLLHMLKARVRTVSIVLELIPEEFRRG